MDDKLIQKLKMLQQGATGQPMKQPSPDEMNQLMNTQFHDPLKMTSDQQEQLYKQTHPSAWENIKRLFSGQ